MLKCPQCNSDLNQDFGMVTCDHCKAVLMIDISGHIQTALSLPFEEAQDEDLDENSFEEPTSSFNGNEISDFSEDAFDEHEEDSTLSESQDEATEANGFENAFIESNQVLDGEDSEAFMAGEFEGDDEDFEPITDELSRASAPDLFEEDEEASGIKPMDGALIENDQYQENLESFPIASEPDSVPVDITGFANSQESSLDDGDLLYDLYVGRLDSKDLRESFKFVLLDKKLKLNHHDYMKKIKNGEVKILDLNPIKAKRIVEQLQYLDLDIKWKQKRVIMEVVEPEIDSEGDLGEDVEI